MAFEEYDDYEQEQLVKEWLGNIWFTIVAGIALGIGGLWGFGQWQNSKAKQLHEAANEFIYLEQALSLEEVTEAEQMISDYQTKFGANIYTVKARLMAAAQLVEQNKLAEAKQHYQALIDAKPEKPLAEMARLRLARLLVSEGDFTGALTQLGLVQSKAYQTLVEEITGDVFLAQGKLSQAQDAYQLALNEGEGYSGKQIVEMKLADVKAAK